MKKITMLFFVLAVSLGYSQTDVIENFDGAGPGLTTDNADCTPLDVNLSTTQAVSAPNSLEIISNAAGHPWQGAKLLLQGDGIQLTTNLAVTMQVYSLVEGGILLKAQNGTGAPSASGANHGGSGWELLTFDFSQGLDSTAPANGVYQDLVIFPQWGLDGGWAGQGGTPCVSNAALTIYVDDIMGTLPPAPTCTDGVMNGDETGVDCGGPDCPECPPTCDDGVMNGDETGVDCGGPDCAACPIPPTSAPNTPPNRDQNSVLSIYSDAYANVATDQRQPFGDAVVTDEDFSGNSVIRATTPLPGAGFQYQYFPGGVGNLDLTDFNFMHIDFYFEGVAATPGTVFIVIIQYAGGLNIQRTFDVTGLPNSTWLETDTAIIDFTNGLNARDQIQQVIVQIAGPDVYGPFWVDNLYFHNNTTLSVDQLDTADFKVFPNPSSDQWNVFSNANVDSVILYDILGKQVMTLSPNSNKVAIDGSSLNPGMYFAKINGVNGSKTVKLIKE